MVLTLLNHEAIQEQERVDDELFRDWVDGQVILFEQEHGLLAPQEVEEDVYDYEFEKAA